MAAAGNTGAAVDKQTRCSFLLVADNPTEAARATRAARPEPKRNRPQREGDEEESVGSSAAVS